MRFGQKQALHTHVRMISIRVRCRNAVGACSVCAAVIDVVACGCEVGGAELMIEAGNNDVALQRVGTAAGLVVRICDGSGTVRRREVAKSRRERPNPNDWLESDCSEGLR